MKLKFFSTRLRNAFALGAGASRESFGNVRTIRVSLYAVLWTLTVELWRTRGH